MSFNITGLASLTAKTSSISNQLQDNLQIDSSLGSTLIGADGGQNSGMIGQKLQIGNLYGSLTNMIGSRDHLSGQGLTNDLMAIGQGLLVNKLA